MGASQSARSIVPDANFLAIRRLQAAQLPVPFFKACRKLATSSYAQKALEGAFPSDHNKRGFQENLDIQQQRVVVDVVKVIVRV